MSYKNHHTHSSVVPVFLKHLKRSIRKPTAAPIHQVPKSPTEEPRSRTESLPVYHRNMQPAGSSKVPFSSMSEASILMHLHVLQMYMNTRWHDSFIKVRPQ